MRQIVLIVAAFLSAIYFPSIVTGLLVLFLAILDPLGAVAVGVFVDLLYFDVHGGIYPVFTLFSLGVALVSLFVRSRLRVATMG